MLIRNKSLVSVNKAPQLWDTLRRIQATLGIDSDKMADLMRMRTRDFERMRLAKADPTCTSTIELGKAINVSFDSIMTNDIDYMALEKQFHGNKAYVPEKYLVAANSRRRTVLTLLDYVKTHYGWDKRLLIMRQFQMTEAMFENPNDLINLGFSVDIINWILNYFRDEQAIINMGRNSFATMKNTELGLMLGKTRNLKELFEVLLGDLVGLFFEKNFRWKLHALDNETVTLRGIPNEEVFGVISPQYTHNKNACLVRKGIISSLPMYLGYPHAEVSKTCCVGHGHDYCEFKIDLNSCVYPLVRNRTHLKMVH